MKKLCLGIKSNNVSNSSDVTQMQMQMQIIIIINVAYTPRI